VSLYNGKICLLRECNELIDPIEPTVPSQLSPRPRLADSALLQETAQRSVAHWRLEAVRQVRFLIGQGFRRIIAQQKIAEALGRSVDDLQAWERELVQSNDLENELLCSEFAGELLEYLRSAHYTNVPHYKAYGTYRDRYNIARAAIIAKTIRQSAISEIRAGLNSKRRQLPSP